MQDAMRIPWIIWLTAAAAGWCAQAASAAGPDRSAASHPQAPQPPAWHIVKRFDFDEARLGNEGNLPMYWERFRGKDYPDFPRYAAGAWDLAFGFNSTESFRLELNGGNVGYYYQRNTIAIAPGQDIHVEAMARTSGLTHARALLEVSLNDARGEMIPGSLRRSPLLGGPGHNDRWVRVAMLVPGKFPAARYVNLSVFLLQPSRWRRLDPAAGEPAELINYIDVHGKAWFDDITVYRLPRVTLTTGHPGQLLPPGMPPSVRVGVEGFANQPLEAELTVRDLANRLIAHQTFSSSGLEQGEARTFRWQGETLPAGLYRAELSVHTGGSRVAGLPPLLTRHLVFAQLPGPTASRSGRGSGFGLILQPPVARLDESAARDLADEQADAVARLPVGLVKLPLWSADHHEHSLGPGRRIGPTAEHPDQADPWADQLIHRLARQRVNLVGTFGRIPPPLQAAPTGPDKSAAGRELGLRRSLLDVFAGDPAVWRPFVAAHLARYAEQIRYWQIGQEDPVPFAMDGRFVPVVNAVRDEFRTLLTNPMFVVTWPALYDYRHAQDKSGPAGPGRGYPAEITSLFLTSRIPAEAMGDYVGQFVGLTDVRPWATIEPLDPQSYQREPRMADLAWRLVTAASALARPLPPAPAGGPATPGSLFMDAPWTLREASGVELLEPAEPLLIFATAAELLAGCSYGGQLLLADGLLAHIFDRGDGTGVLAVRNVGASPDLSVELYLGQQVGRVDLWGNRQAVPTGKSPSAGQLVTAGRLPFYLDGIDPRILRLRASFALDPAFVPSSYKKHTREIRFVNSFETPISGRLTLHFPPNWEVHPKVIGFSVQAGEVFTREIDIRFPYNAEAGAKQLIGDFALDADRTYRIQAPTQFEFGLADVDARTLTQWLSDDQLLVTLNVTNRSDAPVDMFCFVVAPDRPRQERVIAALPPGGAAVKSFRIDKARELVGRSVRVGLREVKGTRIVNYDVPVR